MGVPMVAFTHSVPKECAAEENSPFTFVTFGIACAIATAQEIAGDANVVVSAPSITMKCLELGLLDEIHIDLVPLLLGKTVRLFDVLEPPTELKVVAASGNSHITQPTCRLNRST